MKPILTRFKNEITKESRHICRQIDKTIAIKGATLITRGKNPANHRECVREVMIEEG